MTYTVPTVLFR